MKPTFVFNEKISVLSYDNLDRETFTNIRLRFELFLPTKRFLLRYSNRWQKRSEKGNFSFQQAEVTGRAISFLASTLVENEREEERERGKRRARARDRKSRKIQRAIIRTSRRKIKRFEDTRNKYFLPPTTLFKGAGKITSIEETLKKKRKKRVH